MANGSMILNLSLCIRYSWNTVIVNLFQKINGFPIFINQIPAFLQIKLKNAEDTG